MRERSALISEACNAEASAGAADGASDWQGRGGAQLSEFADEGDLVRGTVGADLGSSCTISDWRWCSEWKQAKDHWW